MFKWMGISLIIFSMSISAHADRRTAKQAFNDGRELFEAGKYKEAALKFRLAYDEKPTWKLLYNIGQCEAGAKNYGLALEAFEQYIIEAGDEIDEQRLEEVQREITRLRPMVGFLKIEGPAGAKVAINGVRRGTLPLSGLVPVSAARDHVISGQTQDGELKTATVKLMTGQTYTVTLGMEASDSIAIADQPPADETVDENTFNDEPTSALEEINENALIEGDQGVAPTAQKDSNKLKNAGIALIVAGGAVVGGGFAVGGVAFLKGKTLSDDNPNGVSGDDIEVRNKYKNMALVGDIMMGVGAATAITGIVLLLVNKKRTNESLNARLSPMLGNVSGLTLEGRF